MSSHKKLLNALGPISNELSELSFGIVSAILRKYFGDGFDVTLVAKIDDAPNISDLRLPFFVNMGVTIDTTGKISPTAS
jgi:hypothetical protein